MYVCGGFAYIANMHHLCKTRPQFLKKGTYRPGTGTKSHEDFCWGGVFILNIGQIYSIHTKKQGDVSVWCLLKRATGHDSLKTSGLGRHYFII